MNARRPGTMIYFDLLNDLEDYTDEEVGKIFRATLNYGLNGEIPVFTDRGMKALWRNIQKAVDVDAHKYGEKVIQRKYAAYCKKAKASGEEPMLYDDWLNEQATEDNESQRVDNEIERDSSENNEPLNPNNEINQLSTINYQLPASNNQQSSFNNQPPSSASQGERKSKRTSLEIPSRSETGFSDVMQEAFETWLQYKKEKKQTYQPTGLKTFIKRLKSCVEQYGENAVIDMLERAISSGYAGPVWESLKNFADSPKKETPKKKEGAWDGFWHPELDALFPPVNSVPTD